ncbi:hypothetical protein Hanom_Chr06g00547131 [Helianthus anomalus]
MYKKGNHGFTFKIQSILPNPQNHHQFLSQISDLRSISFKFMFHSVSDPPF